MMPTLELTVDQVLELIRQLPREDQQRVADALNAEREAWWQEAVVQGESHMRRLSAERGREWDAMSEAEREAFVDDLLHED